MLSIEAFGRTFDVQGSPYTLLVFREEFDDELTDHLSKSYEDSSSVPLEAQMRVLWAMARTADESVPSYPSWLEGFPEASFSLGDVASMGVIDSAIHAELFRGTEAGVVWRARWAAARLLERLAKRIRP